MATTTIDLMDRIRKAGVKAKGFKPSGVRPEVPLKNKEATGLDSMGRVELTLALEEEFGIQLGDEELDAINTFGDLAQAIQQKLG